MLVFFLLQGNILSLILLKVGSDQKSEKFKFLSSYNLQLMIYVKIGIGVHQGYHKHLYDIETCSFYLIYQQYAKNTKNIKIFKKRNRLYIIAATACNNILVIEQW